MKLQEFVEKMLLEAVDSKGLNNMPYNVLIGQKDPKSPGDITIKAFVGQATAGVVYGSYLADITVLNFIEPKKQVLVNCLASIEKNIGSVIDYAFSEKLKLMNIRNIEQIKGSLTLNDEYLVKTVNEIFAKELQNTENNPERALKASDLIIKSAAPKDYKATKEALIKIFNLIPATVDGISSEKVVQESIFSFLQ